MSQPFGKRRRISPEQHQAWRLHSLLNADDLDDIEEAASGPAATRSEREVARINAILDDIELNGNGGRG